MHVFLIAAISIDGHIAQDADQISTGWTSTADKQFFRNRTKQAGAIVMGRTTYQTIGKPLPGRINIVYTRGSVEGLEKLSPNSLKQHQNGYTDWSPQELLTHLEQAGYQELAVCGGASIYTQFLEAGVIDTMYLTVEPVVFGSGVKLFNHLKAMQKFTLSSEKKINNSTVLFEYKIK